jgi:hypothetical protein
MAPKKRGAPASVASKPVRRKDGRPTRAEKSAVNKAISKSSLMHVQAVVENGKAKVPLLRHEGNWDNYPYTEKLGKALFQLIATGHSLDSINDRGDMPPLGVLLSWIDDETHPMSKIYTRAKKMLIPLFEERAHTVALEERPFVIKIKKQVLTKEGDVVTLEEERTVDNTERSRLAAGSFQWTLGHMLPKKHGRVPTPDTGKPNEQLEGLINALKAGPVDN